MQVSYVNVSIEASTDLEPSISQSFLKLRVFHRRKASRGKLYSSRCEALSRRLSSRLSKKLSSRLSSRLSAIVYSTGIAAKSAGSEDWYRSISGRQPYIVP
jgi:hypothetical protein